MSIQPYYELKAALALFSKDCGALTEAERNRAREVASQYAEIEAVVLSSSEASGVCLAPGAVDAAISEIRSRHPDVDSFTASLARAGLTESQLADALHRDLLVEAVMDRVGARSGEVGDTEAEIFYYTHLDRFHSPEKRSARHILITVNEDYPENTAERAEHRIREIARRLENKPARFEEQAIKHSECPTALNGGVLGEVLRGQLYPALDEALFALPVGSLSGVLRTELGLHLLRCDAIHPARTLSYAEVADALRRRLTEDRARRDAKRWLARLLRPAGATTAGATTAG